jgi:hypothetical protein
MRKKRVSSVEVSWIIFGRLRDELSVRGVVSVAVVADPELGWRAVLGPRPRGQIAKDALRKLSSIEKELRAVYSLAEH